MKAMRGVAGLITGAQIDRPGLSPVCLNKILSLAPGLTGGRRKRSGKETVRWSHANPSGWVADEHGSLENGDELMRPPRRRRRRRDEPSSGRGGGHWRRRGAVRAGVPYTRKPVSVYSAGTANIITAAGKHGVRRLIVTGTAAVDPGYRSSDSVIFTRVMEPLFMRLPGRTVYADNRRMEARIRASSLDWTIVRACWLFNAATVSDYQVIEGTIHGMFTARADRAACLLAQLADGKYIRETIGVVTTAGTPSIPHCRHPGRGRAGAPAGSGTPPTAGQGGRWVGQLPGHRGRRRAGRLHPRSGPSWPHSLSFLG